MPSPFTYFFIITTVTATAGAIGDIGDDIVNAIKEFFGYIWQLFKDYLGKPIAEGISGAITSFFKGIQEFFGAVFKSISSPFYTLMTAWHNTIYQFNSFLGPYSFLTPLFLALLICAVVIVIWLIIRYVTPGV